MVGCENVVDSCGELESLRAASRQAELNFQLLKKRYEEELTQFNETRVEHIFKNSGARDYFEKLKEGNKIKDDIIKNLREDLEYKNREVVDLQERCKEAERQSQEYLKAWKGAQMARDKLEAEKKSNPEPTAQRGTLTNQSFNLSSASSLIDDQVPPPPAIDPSIEEIFNAPPSIREQSSYMSLDLSIPPPPDIDLRIDEILGTDNHKDKKAFEQKKGEFLCRVYLNVDSDSSKETLDDIIELIEAEQSRSSSKSFQGWTSLTPRSGAFETCSYHVTLLRGHRSISYHQIKPLVNSVEAYCRNLRPSSLCLDQLKLFFNNEKTRQFLCIASRHDQSSQELHELVTLKQMLRDIIGQFAERLTDEDETDDTIPHCSIMYREVQQVEQNETEIEQDLHEIETLCNENLRDYPLCLLKVDSINLDIGNQVYKFKI